jgi:hypothetical protein
MSPEDQIRMLREENAQLRAAMQGNRYAGASPSQSPNGYGMTPDDLAAANEMSRWREEQAYMGGGMSDLMYRTPQKQGAAPLPSAFGDEIEELPPRRPYEDAMPSDWGASEIPPEVLGRRRPALEKPRPTPYLRKVPTRTPYLRKE